LNKTPDVVFWHMTAFAAPHHLGRDWTTTDKGLREGRIGPQRLTQSGRCQFKPSCALANT
jgi:hypothetical protein